MNLTQRGYYPCTNVQNWNQVLLNKKPILEIDFLLDSGAILNLLNEDTWNELKYNNPHFQQTKSTKTLTAANNTKIQTLGTIDLNLTHIIHNQHLISSFISHNVIIIYWEHHSSNNI